MKDCLEPTMHKSYIAWIYDPERLAHVRLVLNHKQLPLNCALELDFVKSTPMLAPAMYDAYVILVSTKRYFHLRNTGLTRFTFF